MTYTIAVCTVKNSWWWTRNFPKLVEFYSQNKFEKLVHLVGFSIRIYHDARSPERQISNTYLLTPWRRVLEKVTGLQVVKKSPPPISRNPKVHYRTHKRPPTVSILGQPNPVHIPTSHLQEIRPNIIHPSTPRSPQWSLSLRFLHQDPIHPPSPHPYIPHAQPNSFFSILSPAQYWVRSKNHSAPRYAVSLIPPLPRPFKVQIFSSTPCSQTPSASFPPAMSATKFHTHT